jgi:hypothetical protein
VLALAWAAAGLAQVDGGQKSTSGAGATHLFTGVAMNNKIIVLRPSLPLRSAQPRTKKVVAQQRVIRDLSARYRSLRNVRKQSARRERAKFLEARQ